MFQYSMAGTTGMGEVGTPPDQVCLTFLECRVFNSLNSRDACHIIIVVKVVVSWPRQVGLQGEVRMRTK